ncbi:DUF4148 domain-containing protein [Glaciimonas sp. Gout2]|uniref:DUF4148 domain-containing protein n=1 Tax=unclassified Glaciimonas TaxID=2644401 RepID=UPI002B236CB3|nr:MULTISPECIES: DUF4148 domain-containing protein [unclassified Glaciimonas]MEB0011407.1 DUF4148 domain-containing protein [Glaciimonas sp. Cout2]MEB0081058.1 DUF4148 domain-containing protein [Glaciimonas sp. Gout2]
MKTNHLIAILVISISSAAVFAQPASAAISGKSTHLAYPRNDYPVIPSISTKTRAEVVAELKQAQAQGLITNRNNYPIILTAPRKTRDQFQSTNVHANASGYDASIYDGA